MSDIKEQLSQLNKISKKSVALYHKVALSGGVSDSALGVLYALWESDDSLSQYDLCNEQSIPKQTVNSSVASLLKKGFVSLTPIAGARNKKCISLTDAGREFAENTVGRLMQAELDAFATLTPEERVLYIALNEKYNCALTENLDSVFGTGDIGI